MNEDNTEENTTNSRVAKEAQNKYVQLRKKQRNLQLIYKWPCVMLVLNAITQCQLQGRVGREGNLTMQGQKNREGRWESEKNGTYTQYTKGGIGRPGEARSVGERLVRYQNQRRKVMKAKPKNKVARVKNI